MALLDAGLQDSPMASHSCTAAVGPIDSPQARRGSSTAVTSAGSSPGVLNSRQGSVSMSPLGLADHTPTSGSDVLGSRSSSARLFSTPPTGLRPGTPTSPNLFERMELDQGGLPDWETTLFGPPILLNPDLELLESSALPQAAPPLPGIDWDTVGLDDLELYRADASGPQGTALSDLNSSVTHSRDEANFIFLNGSTAATLQQRGGSPVNLFGSPHRGAHGSEQAVDSISYAAPGQGIAEPVLDHPFAVAPALHDTDHGNAAGAATDYG